MDFSPKGGGYMFLSFVFAPIGFQVLSLQAAFCITVAVVDGLLFKKMINRFLIISKAFSQQPVGGWVVGSGTATACYRLSRRGGFASITFHSGRKYSPHHYNCLLSVCFSLYCVDVT